MEESVFSLDDGGIPHELVFSRRRRQERLSFVQRFPLIAISAVRQVQAIFAIANKIAEQIMSGILSERRVQGAEKEEDQVY